MANAKHTVKGEKTIPGYDDPDIEVEVDEKYEAYSKGSVPAAGDYTVGNETIRITWFNNFGVREKSKKTGDLPGQDANITYTVKLKKLPKRKRLFALYKDTDKVERAHELLPTDVDDKNMKFTLNVGDPPLGSGP